MVSKVREIRKERQITQDYLARMVEISRKYLSLIETNRATPSVDIAVRIADGLSVNIDKITSEDPNQLGRWFWKYGMKEFRQYVKFTSLCVQWSW